MIVRAIADIEKEVYSELNKYAETIEDQNMARVIGGLVTEALQERGFRGRQSCEKSANLCR